MKKMLRFVGISFFGLLGVLSRYGVGLLVNRFVEPPFPYGTFGINLVGAFLIGVAYVAGVEKAVLPGDLRVSLMVGFLGGFTTFSSYCLESFQLISESEYVMAAVYFILSPCLGLLCTLAGVFLTRQVLP